MVLECFCELGLEGQLGWKEDLESAFAEYFTKKKMEKINWTH